ncbi:MAG: carboxypeptidase-like regulatory domain-containing protein, partial [Lewinellaceae bacterium]|nr:carboxypeptidase-like regulatory domain-containing protein [Lewinellaceae bacterium]
MKYLPRNVLWLLLVFLLPAGTVWAQTRTVSGTVTDATDNSPMIGVTVQVVGTTDGTITDLDGRYQIQLPRGQTLRFSFTGYATQEVTILDQTLLDIVMDVSSTALSEV